MNFEKPHTTEPYNTNNAWGFGGGIGTKYIFSPDLYVKVGLAGTRHRGEFPYTTLTWKGNRILDLSGKGVKQLIIANKWVNAIIEKRITSTEVDGTTVYTIQELE